MAIVSIESLNRDITLARKVILNHIALFNHTTDNNSSLLNKEISIGPCISNTFGEINLIRNI